VTGTISAGRVGEQSSPGVNQTYAIKWQTRLPTAWNGRFVHVGGGGTDGSVPATTSRLSDGYVMAADDSGHDNNANNDPLAAGTGTFGTDPQARVDFAYSAIDRTQQVAKGLIQLYYAEPQQYAYFEGCSMGGREAMMVTQRLPTAFDGVVVGDPAFKFASMLTHAIYNSQVLGSLASSMGILSRNGLPLVNNTYTNQDLQLISKAVLDACDALDGLADGIVNKPLQCTSGLVYPKLDALQCSGTKTATCLSAAQIDAFKKIYEGPVTPSGSRPYYPWMWDPGIAGCTSAVDCNTPQPRISQRGGAVGSSGSSRPIWRLQRTRLGLHQQPRWCRSDRDRSDTADSSRQRQQRGRDGDADGLQPRSVDRVVAWHVGQVPCFGLRLAGDNDGYAGAFREPRGQGRHLAATDGRSVLADGNGRLV